MKNYCSDCSCHLFVIRNEIVGTIEIIASQPPSLIQTEDSKSCFSRDGFGEKSGRRLEHFLCKANISRFVSSWRCESEDISFKPNTSHILAKFPSEGRHDGC